MTSWRNRVEVSYGALRHNVAAVRAAAGDRALIAVVKADAYGLGLERCARIYLEAGAAAVGVAALSEADRVRRAVPGARVVLLGSPLPEERRAVAASGYEVTISTLDEAVEFAHVALPGKPVAVHVGVDTGMGRAGALPAQAAEIVRAVQRESRLRLAGISTHYPDATNATQAAGQERALAEVLAGLGPLDEHTWVHVANSEGLLCRPLTGTHAVRVGLLLVGERPPACPDQISLRFAVRWVSSVTLVKDLPKGHGISYCSTHTLRRDSRVALVPVGYADGYPWALGNKGSLLVGGRRCPILGRVTMDYCMIDVTDLPQPPVPGDQVVLLGSQGGETITLDELAGLAGTIPYDILCGLRGRCEIVGVP